MAVIKLVPKKKGKAKIKPFFAPKKKGKATIKRKK